MPSMYAMYEMLLSSSHHQPLRWFCMKASTESDTKLFGFAEQTYNNVNILLPYSLLCDT